MQRKRAPSGGSPLYSAAAYGRESERAHNAVISERLVVKTPVRVPVHPWAAYFSDLLLGRSLGCWDKIEGLVRPSEGLTYIADILAYALPLRVGTSVPRMIIISS